MNVITFGTSRGGGTLVFYDLLKYIMENGLWIVGVVNLRADTQYVAAFFDVILYIIVSTLISELCHFNLLIGKLFI